MANATQTSLSDTVKTQYEKRLLTRAQPRLLHGRWPTKARINKYGAYELRKYSALSAVTSALTEGATPAEQAVPTISTVTMTPVFYGAYIIYTDELEMTAFDPIVSEFTSILGEQAGLSADTIYRTEMITDCTTDYTNGAAAIGTLAHPAYDVSYADVVYQVAELEAQSALPMENDNFIVILHPHSYASLMQDEVFVNMFEKESDPAMRSGYVGRLLRCIFFVTANAYEQADTGSGSTTDVYSMLFLGRESYGSLGIGNLEPSVVDNQGDNGRPLTGQQIRPVEVIMKGLGSGGSVDPLDQRGTLAWKMALDVEVLNSSWIRNLKHTNVFSDD